MANHQQLDDFFGSSNGSVPERIRDALSAKRLSLWTRIRLLPKVLSRQERYLVLSLVIVALGALLSLPLTSYIHFTSVVPAPGGTLVEGVIGGPRLVNPILNQLSDTDRDLAALMYSGLYRYDGNGRLVPDLATSMPEVTSDGLSYSVTINTGALWHDGVPVTADDIVFTVGVAQNQDYGAPANIRSNWQGVQVERASDRVVIFHLKAAYAQFPNNLTLGILPKHLWQDVRPINFSLSELNLKPVGSGPYRFSSLTKDSLGRIISYKLAAWSQFYSGRPNIDQIEFRFYDSEDGLLEALRKGDVDNVGYVSGSRAGEIKSNRRLELSRLKMPRYFALFFNQGQSKALADKNVRLALNEGTDRVAIINQALDGNAFLVNSPMIGGILDVNPNVTFYDYDPDQAALILKSSGWNAEADGVLKSPRGGRLEIKITTSTFPELAAVAQLIKTQWERLGAKVLVETLPISQLQQVIADRSYQVLLFGELMPLDPDPFPFWHSSQRQGAGLNLALYDNPTADKLMEEARQTLDPIARRSKYNDFQNIVISDIPAVFLYSPDYLYGLNRDVKGFDTTLIGAPSDRFTNVVHWYLETQRELK